MWSLPRSGVPASNADAALGVADQMPELVEEPRLAEPVRGQMCHWDHVGGDCASWIWYKWYGEMMIIAKGCKGRPTKNMETGVEPRTPRPTAKCAAFP